MSCCAPPAISSPIRFPVRPSIVSPFGDPGPVPFVSWDFTSGGKFPDLTYGALFEGATSIDSLIYRPGGEARTTSLGLLSEAQTGNKSVNFNMKMTDTSGTTPDASWTTHEAVALGSLPSEVFNTLPPFTPGKLTAVYHSVSNAAGEIVIDGVTGTTNPHHGNGWVYVVSGDFGFAIGTGSDTTAVQGEWIRIGDNDLAPLATDQLRAITTQASEAYWFGDQLEENDVRTSLIEVNGSAVTRLGDYPYTTPPGLPDYTAFTVVIEFQVRRNSNVAQRLLTLGTSTRLEDSIAAGVTFNQEVSDAVASAVTDGALPDDIITRHAYGIDGTILGFSIDGVDQGTTAIPAADPYTQIVFGGITGNLRQPNGYIRKVAIHNRAATPAFRNRASA